MKILFDHNVDRRFRKHLPSLEVRTVREMGWDRLRNRLLLRAAATSGFGGVITIDKKMEFEQNLTSLPVAVVLLDSISNALPSLIPFAQPLASLLSGACEPGFYVIDSGGGATRITSPREDRRK